MDLLPLMATPTVLVDVVIGRTLLLPLLATYAVAPSGVMATPIGTLNPVIADPAVSELLTPVRGVTVLLEELAT